MSYHIYETSCVFLYPQAFGEWIKTRNEFHKYCMKRKFMKDSSYHMLSHKNVRKIQIYQVFLHFNVENVPSITYVIKDELRHQKAPRGYVMN